MNLRRLPFLMEASGHAFTLASACIALRRLLQGKPLRDDDNLYLDALETLLDAQARDALAPVREMLTDWTAFPKDLQDPTTLQTAKASVQHLREVHDHEALRQLLPFLERLMDAWLNASRQARS